MLYLVCHFLSFQYWHLYYVLMSNKSIFHVNDMLLNRLQKSLHDRQTIIMTDVRNTIVHLSKGGQLKGKLYDLLTIWNLHSFTVWKCENYFLPQCSPFTLHHTFEHYKAKKRKVHGLAILRHIRYKAKELWHVAGNKWFRAKDFIAVTMLFQSLFY